MNATVIDKNNSNLNNDINNNVSKFNENIIIILVEKIMNLINL